MLLKNIIMLLKNIISHFSSFLIGGDKTKLITLFHIISLLLEEMLPTRICFIVTLLFETF